MRIPGLYCHQAKLTLLSREKKSSISRLLIPAPSARASFFCSLQQIPVSSEHTSLQSSSLHMLTSPSPLFEHYRHDWASPSPEEMGKVCAVGYPSGTPETCWVPDPGHVLCSPSTSLLAKYNDDVDYFSIIFDLLSINSAWLQWQ